MNKKVLITADSTCDLSPELCEKYTIKINPMPIIKDNEAFKDGVEITPDLMYEHYEKTGRLIRTSAPNIDEYGAFFRPLLDDGYEIVHFTISASMSASNQICNNFADTVEGIYTVDSANLSTGIGLQVLRAVELRDKGLSAKEIYEDAVAVTDKVDTSFVLDTLEFLHRGGRCSGLAAFGANLLKLKPCIEVKNGAMGVGKKYRGSLADVHKEYIDARLADVDDLDPGKIFITHSGISQELIDNAKKCVEEKGIFDEILVTRAGCAVSVHCGPNTLGILFIRKSPLVK